MDQKSARNSIDRSHNSGPATIQSSLSGKRLGLDLVQAEENDGDTRSWLEQSRPEDMTQGLQSQRSKPPNSPRGAPRKLLSTCAAYATTGRYWIYDRHLEHHPQPSQLISHLHQHHQHSILQSALQIHAPPYIYHNLEPSQNLKSRNSAYLKTMSSISTCIYLATSTPA